MIQLREHIMENKYYSYCLKPIKEIKFICQPYSKERLKEMEEKGTVCKNCARIYRKQMEWN
jgi:hypothetical protein